MDYDVLSPPELEDSPEGIALRQEIRAANPEIWPNNQQEKTASDHAATKLIADFLGLVKLDSEDSTNPAVAEVKD